MNPPPSLDIREHLDGLEVVLPPPKSELQPGPVITIGSALCGVGGMLIAGEVATRGPMFTVSLIIGAILGVVVGAALLQLALIWIINRSTNEDTERVRVGNQQLIIQHGLQAPRTLHYEQIHAVQLDGGNLLLLCDSHEVIQLGAHQTEPVLRWLHRTITEQHTAWQSQASTESAIPASLQRLRGETV